MSNTVDQRVVEMQFDNSQFESGVKTSLNTIEDLRKSLNLTGATKGLENIDYAAKSVNMSPLSSAVESIATRFSALEVVAITALANITNQAVNSGKKLLSAFTIDPVKTGLSEYETQINAIQTVLANTESKGTTLGDVNKALDELNKYADKTIYNFTEMTRNIGTFTAAGVELDTSVAAIKGIANLAAVSGSTSQQASTAMYQLSQALSSGTVKLMDWNSVVNAGMGGQVFQDALKETARVHGIAIDDMIAEEGSFRETLTNGWLSSEVLLETLQKFTGDMTKDQLKAMGYTDEQIKGIIKMGETANNAATKVKTFTQLIDTLKEAAQSGWTQTWEILIGDFEQAKSLWTAVSDVVGDFINKTSEARNALLQGWADKGGRELAIVAIKNAFEGLLSIVKPIKEAFKEVFPTVTADNLVKITKAIVEFTKKLKLSDGASEDLKTTFKGLFSVVKIVAQIFGAALKFVSPLLTVFGAIGRVVLKVTSIFASLLIKIGEFTDKTKIFSRLANLIIGVFDAVGNIINGVVDTIGAFIKSAEGFDEVSESVLHMKDRIVGAFKAIGDSIANGNFTNTLKKVLTALSPIFEGLINMTQKLLEGLGNVFKGLSFEGILNLINTIVLGKISFSVASFFDTLRSSVEDVGGILSSFSGILDGVRDTLKALQTEIKANAMIKIASAIIILAAAILIIASIDTNALYDSLGAITTLFAELALVMALVGKLQMNPLKFGSLTNSMIKISVAMLVMALALKSIAKIDSNNLMAGVTAMAGLSAIIVGTAYVLSKNENAVIKGGTSMILFAAAMKIMASACADLAALDWNGLAKGLLGVATIMGAIGLFITYTKFDNKKMISNALGMVLLASALKIIASACMDLATLNWNDLAQGLLGVSVILGALGVFLNKVDFGNKKVISNSLGVVLIASAVKILASACSDLAKLDWNGLVKGLAGIGVVLAEILGFIKLTNGSQNLLVTGIGLIAIAAATKILASAITDISKLSWGSIAKGLVALAGSLTAITVAVRLMPQNMATIGAGLLIVSGALLVMASALKIMGSMAWESVAKGLALLGGSMAILAVGLRAMNGTLAGSAALVVATIALAALTPVLLSLSMIGIKGLAVSLITLAGAFTIIGVAAKLLSPTIGPLLALAGSIALIGVGMMAFGASLVLAASGLAGVAAGLAALVAVISQSKDVIVGFIETFVKSFINLIPSIAEALAIGLVSIAEVITNSAGSITGAFITLIDCLLEAINTSVPKIVNVLLNVLMLTLEGITQYIPEIVDFLFEFVIRILDKIAERTPDLVKSIVNVLMSVFKGVLGALENIDPKVLLDGIMAMTLLTALMVALGLVAGLVPSAMVGVLGMGVVVSELALVLAAIGALAQLPGLDWLIKEGGNFLEVIGTAIGQFIGGIAGGIAKGFSSSLPDIGDDLSDFMKNLKPFIDGAKSIDESVMTGVKTLIGVIAALTAANFLDGITKWFTGGTSFADFGEEIATLGPCLKKYSDSVSGIDIEAVNASVGAMKALSEMADAIPNRGGLTALLSGENSLARFGVELVPLGLGLKEFSKTVDGVNAENIKEAAEATKAIADATSVIPNQNGLVAWVTGDISIAKFSAELIALGLGLKGFSKSVEGIDAESIKAAAESTKAIADATSVIPDQGGLMAWITGDNSISKFSLELINLGLGLKGFAKSVEGINTENVMAASGAAKALAEMAAVIPNQGGLVTWFTGENSIAMFGAQLPILGAALKGFSDSVSGINPENLIAASNAAKTLAEMSAVIPNQGGLVTWFTGENSIARFSGELVSLGFGLRAFSVSVEGINPENLTSAINAAKTLAEMSAILPNQGGMVAWFTGENSVAAFGTELISLGVGLKGFSDSVSGVVPENITSAANAAKALAEMTNIVPKSGGMVAWFTGEHSLAKLGDDLPNLGKGLKSFSDAVAGINPENVSVSATAAKSLAETIAAIPADSSHITNFGKNADSLGTSLKSYFTKTSSISDEAVKSVKNLIEAVNSASTVDTGKLDSVTSSVDSMVDAFKGLSNTDKYASEFKSALKSLGETSANALLEPFEDLGTDMNEAAINAVNKFVNGIENNLTKIKNAGKSVAEKCASAISKESSSFKDAGKAVVQGFANGIDTYTYIATAKAKAMALAALKAAKEALGINSPSKEFYKNGKFAGQGFVNALDDFATVSYDSGYAMARSAKNGLNDAISKISDTINGNMDVQPTIRPVLDLSDIESGAGTIGDLLGSGSTFGVLSNIGTINSAMNRRGQNGANSELLSAVNKLRGDLRGVRGNTYNVNGITYDDGSNISEAVKTLIRAAMVERRI